MVEYTYSIIDRQMDGYQSCLPTWTLLLTYNLSKPRATHYLSGHLLNYVLIQAVSIHHYLPTYYVRSIKLVVIIWRIPRCFSPAENIAVIYIHIIELPVWGPVERRLTYIRIKVWHFGEFINFKESRKIDISLKNAIIGQFLHKTI